MNNQQSKQGKQNSVQCTSRISEIKVIAFRRTWKVNVWLPTDPHRSARGRDWIPLEPWPFQDLWAEPAVASHPNSSVLDSSGRGLYYQNDIITSWHHGMSVKLLQPVEVLQHPDAQQGGDLMPHSIAEIYWR